MSKFSILYGQEVPLFDCHSKASLLLDIERRSISLAKKNNLSALSIITYEHFTLFIIDM